MKTVHKSVLLWHSAEQMFTLVTDVARYSEFLPWCYQTRVLEHTAEGMVAEIGMSLSGFKKSFTTRNIHLPGRQVRVELVDGPFKHLDGVCHVYIDDRADPEGSATAALSAAALTGNTNTTKPQRSSSLHLLNCSLNAYGGSFFWRANKMDECVTIVGNTASLGEVSLSAFTGGTPGAIGAHMIYESL